MRTLFRTFQWSGIAVVLVLTAVLRLAGVLSDALPAGAPALGPAGALLPDASDPWAWALGVVAVTALGFYAAYSLQYYRLGSAGTWTGFTGACIASGSALWLGTDATLVSTLCLAVAAHRLFEGYRYQGAAVPVFDCGLFIGLAWLITPAYLWFALWAALALGQLRKFRLADLLNLLLGVLALPAIAAMYSFVWGDLGAFRQNLFSGIAGGPLLPGFRESGMAELLAFGLLAACTAWLLLGFGAVTARRPIQEQRAFRMYYTMLGIGWLALLLSGPFEAWSMALVIYPTILLSGVYISELPRKWIDYAAFGLLGVSIGLQLLTLLVPA